MPVKLQISVMRPFHFVSFSTKCYTVNFVRILYRDYREYFCKSNNSKYFYAILSYFKLFYNRDSVIKVIVKICGLGNYQSGFRFLFRNLSGSEVLYGVSYFQVSSSMSLLNAHREYFNSTFYCSLQFVCNELLHTYFLHF